MISLPSTHSIRLTRNPAAGAAAKLVLLLSLLSCASSATLAAQSAAARPNGDGPVGVEGANIFKEGKLTFEEIDPAKVAPLPKGWAALNNTAYRVSFGEGVMRGPNMLVRFSVASASDRKLFESLFVLQAVWDRFDERYVWADRTDAGARDFNTKTIGARTDDLGVFVIAREVEPQPLKKVVADLSVEIVAPQGRAIGNRELAYDVRVTNRGPQAVEGFVLHGAGFSSDEFVSATPPAQGSGRCKQDGSNYDCRLGALAKGETAVVRLVLVPRERTRAPSPEEGRGFTVFAYVASAAEDPNPDDNQARSNLVVFPDPNQGPQVKLVAPARNELFVAPADIKLTAEASDPEGAPLKVEFYAGTKLLGAGEPAGKNLYGVVWRGATPGPHQLVVVVTDAGGRQDYDTFWVRVNGPLVVRVASPKPDSAFNRTSDHRVKGQATEITYGPLKFEAEALVGAGAGEIKEVVFRVNEELTSTREWKKTATRAGADAATGEARYVAAFDDLSPGAYKLTVIATDGEGVETVSSAVPFRVKAAPLLKLRDDAAALRAPADVTLVAEMLSDYDMRARDRGGKVDFYADGKLVGSAALDSFSGVATFNWRGVPAGTYSLTAVATDGQGHASAPSSPLRVTVR